MIAHLPGKTTMKRVEDRAPGHGDREGIADVLSPGHAGPSELRGSKTKKRFLKLAPLPLQRASKRNRMWLPERVAQGAWRDG